MTYGRLDLIFPVSLRGVKTRTALLIDIVNEEFCLYCAPWVHTGLGFRSQMPDTNETSTFFDTLPFYNRGTRV